MKEIKDILNSIQDFMTMQLYKVNEVPFTPMKILLLVLSIVLLFYISIKIKNIFLDKLLSRSSMSRGSKYAIASISRYIVFVLGLLVILSQVGFDLDTLTVIFGALGVGIGFGLQHIINNFVSGIIILLEKPIQVGDRVEVEGIEGDVIEISMRATKVKTNDNVTHIVPNGEFISKRVINWSHGDPKVRRRIPVGVAYGSDPEKIRELLLEVAKEEPAVMDDPEPDVFFEDFGDSSLNFLLRVWTVELTSRPGLLKSKLNFAIAKKFKENDIKIPFPQRDIYIKEKP